LDQVFEAGIVEAKDLDGQTLKATHLINVLYDTLISVDTYGEERSDAVSYLFQRLFVSCFLSGRTDFRLWSGKSWPGYIPFLCVIEQDT
jgi:hypothetical protein